MNPTEIKRGLILNMIATMLDAKDPKDETVQERLMNLAAHTQGPHLEELGSKLSGQKT